MAADELRAELAGETVTFVVNRNINVSNVCVVGCAFCGFGQGRRSPEAYEHDEREIEGRVLEAIEFGASEICMQSGIHPEWRSRTTCAGCAWSSRPRRRRAWSCICTPTARWRSRTCATSPACPPDEVFARLADAGLGSTPGTAAEVLHDGVRERISPNKLPVARWVEIIEASHRAGLRSTATVMFGHIEEPWELAEHMRVVRALQERTGGITEFVPLSFIPFQTLLGRTHGVQEISEAENLKHTAVFRLALGTLDSQPPGLVGEDGPGRGERVAALGRERPRGHAHGGVDQPHGGLLPRHPSGPRAARGRRPPRGPPGGRAHDALRDQAQLRLAAGACRGLIAPVAGRRKRKLRTLAAREEIVDQGEHEAVVADADDERRFGAAPLVLTRPLLAAAQLEQVALEFRELGAVVLARDRRARPADRRRRRSSAAPRRGSAAGAAAGS